MDKKLEELVALGAAYAVNCQFCMEYHKKLATEAGLTREEMHAAIQVAESVKTGAANRNKQSAGGLFGDIVEKRCCPAGSDCCP